MNQGRIWCVVNPTVGLPLFIGGVAVTSLVVHASVMSHTTWMSNYWQGAAAKTARLIRLACKGTNLISTAPLLFRGDITPLSLSGFLVASRIGQSEGGLRRLRHKSERQTTRQDSGRPTCDLPCAAPAH